MSPRLRKTLELIIVCGVLLAAVIWVVYFLYGVWQYSLPNYGFSGGMVAVIR